jgi:hypothetical protein
MGSPLRRALGLIAACATVLLPVASARVKGDVMRRSTLTGAALALAALIATSAALAHSLFYGTWGGGE